MQDPKPENITGEKVARHSFKHQINWGHVVLGGAAILLLLKFGPPLLDATSGNDGQPRDDVSVEVIGQGG